MIEPSRRVLVIEDDSTLREILGEVMTDEGYEVRLAADGEAGLGELAGWTPDLILLDVMMPRLNAFELRERLAKLEDRPPIVLISAARDLAGVAERVGADAWLAKPFSLAEVIETADRLVTRHRS